jgi:MFS family permease
MSATASTTAQASALEPLKRPVFRILWLGLIVSSMGSWMHDVGAAWLMTTLAPEPLMVSLVQAATLLPLFLLTLPAGALADIVNRRRYLIFTQFWLMGTAGTLGVLTLSGLTNEWILLGMTLAMGCGTAMMMPAFSAMIPDLVPRNELTAAITLNSIAFNATRAMGPAVAGAILAATSPGIVFVVNALSFSAVIWAIFRWRSRQQASSLPSERFIGSMRTGMRYARRATELHTVILRGLALFLSMSAPLAFLPLVVKTELQAGPRTYGLLLSCIGAGAVGTGFLLPAIRRRFSTDAVILMGTCGVVLASVALAYVRFVPLLGIALVLLGACWISAQSTLQVTAQLSLPGWVRARGLAVFIASFMGVMALGAATWGKVASLTSIETALLTEASVGALGTLLTSRLSLESVASRDTTPAESFIDPQMIPTADSDRGPVLVSIDYEVDPEHSEDFVEAMQEVRRVRLRNGSSAWGLFQDTGAGTQFTEVFLDQSWLDHLRQNERVTMEDRRAMDAAIAFHRGAEPPRVTHRLAPRRPRRR